MRLTAISIRSGRTSATSERSDVPILSPLPVSRCPNDNHTLVKDGWCWWYRKYAPGNSELDRLEKEAREAKQGLWIDQHPAAPCGFLFDPKAKISKPPRSKIALGPLPFVEDRRSRHSTLVLTCRRFPRRRHNLVSPRSWATQPARLRFWLLIKLLQRPEIHRQLEEEIRHGAQRHIAILNEPTALLPSSSALSGSGRYRRPCCLRSTPPARLCLPSA